MDALMEPRRIAVRGRLFNPHLVRPIPARVTPIRGEPRRPKYVANVVILDETTPAEIMNACMDVCEQRWGWEHCVQHRLPLLWRARWGNAPELSEKFLFTAMCRKDDPPAYRDETGMPTRPDIFQGGETVEIDAELRTVQFHMDVLGGIQRTVVARLCGLRFLGGFVRSTQ